MEPLKNLNELHNGLYKRWVWRDIESYWCGIDCVQKINFSIQDLNHEVTSLSERPMKEIVARVQIDKLYALDKYLAKQKRADYIKKDANKNDKTSKVD